MNSAQQRRASSARGRRHHAVCSGVCFAVTAVAYVLSTLALLLLNSGQFHRKRRPRAPRCSDNC